MQCPCTQAHVKKIPKAACKSDRVQAFSSFSLFTKSNRHCSERQVWRRWWVETAEKLWRLDKIARLGNVLRDWLNLSKRLYLHHNFLEGLTYILNVSCRIFHITLQRLPEACLKVDLTSFDIYCFLILTCALLWWRSVQLHVCALSRQIYLDICQFSEIYTLT